MQNIIATKLNGEDIFICQKHSQNITLIIMESQKALHEILMCPLCHKQCSVTKNLNSISNFMKYFKQQFEKTNEDLRKKKILIKKTVEELKLELKTVQEKISEHLCKVHDELNELILEIDKIGKENSDILKGIEQFKNNKFIDADEQFVNAIQFHFVKIKNTLKESFTSFKMFSSFFVNWLKLITAESQKKNTQIVKIENEIVIDSKIPLTSLLYANYQKSIIEGSEKNIIIRPHPFDNNNLMILKINLEKTTCLISSQKRNWFASGHAFGAIAIWKLMQDNKWVSNQPKQQVHIQQVNCLILSQNEDLLFSCANDSFIKIWKIDMNENKIDFINNLKGSSLLNCIILNKSENLLLCCQTTNKLLLWKKKDSWWSETCQIISIPHHGCKICFISNFSFILQCQEQKELLVYLVAADQVIQNKSIELKDQLKDGTLEHSLEKNSILVHKCQKYLYIFKINKLGNIETYKDFELEDNKFIFTLDNDGKKLFVWIKQKLKIFEINFYDTK